MEVKDNGSNIGDIDVSENELEQWIKKKNQHDILILLPSNCYLLLCNSI